MHTHMHMRIRIGSGRNVVPVVVVVLWATYYWPTITPSTCIAKAYYLGLYLSVWQCVSVVISFEIWYFRLSVGSFYCKNNI